MTNLSTRVAEALGTLHDIPDRTTPTPAVQYAIDPATLVTMLNWIVGMGWNYDLIGRTHHLRAIGCVVRESLATEKLHFAGNTPNEAVARAVVAIYERMGRC